MGDAQAGPDPRYRTREKCLSARERSREREEGEDAVLEAGHGPDPVASERENVEADPVADAGGATQVGPERRLTVRPCPHQVEPSTRVEEACAEAGHDVSSLISERHRRHRDESVLREE